MGVATTSDGEQNLYVPADLLSRGTNGPPSAGGAGSRAVALLNVAVYPSSGQDLRPLMCEPILGMFINLVQHWIMIRPCATREDTDDQSLRTPVALGSRSPGAARGGRTDR